MRRGFTLLELIVVAALLALLAAMVVPRLTGMARREGDVVAERLSELLSLFALRDNSGSVQSAIWMNGDTGCVELWTKESDPEQPTEPPQWIPDRFVRVTVQMTQQQLNRLPEEIRTAAKVKDREFMGAMIAGALSRGEDVPGAQLGDLGASIQQLAESSGYSIVREFCGHGIGRRFHEDPQILHYGKAGTGITLVPGMIFTVEPMINAGRRDIRELADGWTIVTKDHSLSAQWEHTVLVTDSGFEILTRSAGSPLEPVL
ncbi:MAG: M24 family metallopeptidase [Betaproteobacteria bacterium]|nr:M24 family metallopeptidase [Betaproteobacteria bacterium]